MKISVIGSGYVGTTTAALLANAGHMVVAIDINKERVNNINSGKAPFYEKGLDQLINKAVESKTLSASTSYDFVYESDIVFSCVGTPDNPDGSPNLEYIYSSVESASPLLKEGAIFVQKSTVPPGTGKALIEKISKLASKSFNYVSNPEFLRESTAIKDTLLFDRVVVGGDDKESLNKIEKLYRSIESNSEKIAKIAGFKIQDKLSEHAGQYIQTNLQSAELIKVTANAFLALKISFANSIAKLADSVDADIVEVMDAVGADQRIGRAFLNAGRGYGGGCFPKDVSGLISSAQNNNVDLHIMSEAQDVNKSMPGYIANKIKKATNGLTGVKVAILGLAFKPGTSDARKSPAVKLANILDHEGAVVVAYDPQANQEARQNLRKNVKVKESFKETVLGAEVVIVSTDWPEFKKEIKNFKKVIFIDAMNAYSKQDFDQSVTYIGVGK